MNTRQFSRIAIVGAGALGTYYGARLALAGAEVRFLTRSDAERIRAAGLTLREKDATRRLELPAIFTDPAAIGPVDLVIVTLKTTANAVLPDWLPPLVGDGTTVLTLQNGLGNEEFIASIVGVERLLGGLCYIGVVRGAPGELVGFHTPGAMAVGEFGRAAGERAHAIGERFHAIGVKTRVVDDLAEARWQKLVWNVPFNGLAIAAGGITTDRIMGTPEIEAQVRPLMEELAEAGRHLGYRVSENFIQAQIDLTKGMGAYQPSSLVDFLAGREVEVEAIWGEPLRRAQAVGVAMPRLENLYAELKRLTAN